jgi:hypothetical protein
LRMGEFMVTGYRLRVMGYGCFGEWSMVNGERYIHGFILTSDFRLLTSDF